MEGYINKGHSFHSESLINDKSPKRGDFFSITNNTLIKDGDFIEGGLCSLLFSKAEGSSDS